MLKLVHGIASWLLGREVSVHRGEFSFARPRHGDDYAFLFPGPVHCDAGTTSMYLSHQDCAQQFKREKHER